MGWKRLGFAALSIALSALAFFSFGWGFNQLSDVRQLDRLPITPLSAVTQGLYAVEGTVEDRGTTIVTPYSNENVVYFSYKLEEEYTDSDGNRKTRTLDSGQSATPFWLTDFTSDIRIDPGVQLGNTEWAMKQTYRQKSGNRIYTEHALRAGDRIQLLGWYDYRQSRFELSESDRGLSAIVTHATLKKEGGDTLLGASLLISLAAGCVAVALAAALVVFNVHRYWVFVVIMTLGLIATLWGIGAVHLQKDWQQAAEFYNERREGAMASNQTDAMEDLFAMYALIEKSASQWPDNVLFAIAEQRDFKPPSIDASTQERIRSRLFETEKSKNANAWLVIIIALGAALFTAGLIYAALRAIKFKRLVEFIPTSQSTGLAYGIAELFGMINVDEDKPHLQSKLNNEKCVSFKYDISEKRGSGKNARWVTIEEGEEHANFWLEDELGKVDINPTGANIVYPEKNVDQQGRTRYTEYWLPPFRNIYCLGFAGIADADADQLSIQKSDDFMYLITTQEEEEVVRGKGAAGFMLTGLALGFSLVAGTALLSGSGTFTPLDLIKVSLIVPLVLSLITAILHYNGLVFLKNRVDKTRADIDTLLQRRHDLWPRLLNTLTGYMAHEKKLLTAISRLRNGQKDYSSDPEQAEKQLAFEKKVVDAVNARVEAHPDLKSNTVVQTFQRQMKRTEDELALIRQGYNDSVELYNTQIEKLPDVILAKLFGFKAAGLFNKSE